MKKLFLSISVIAFCAGAAHSQAWLAQTSNIDPNNWVQFIDAVDSNVCWGLSASRTGQTTPVQEYTKTTDGGNTWNAGIITNATGLGPSNISAINADTAWVAMFNPTGGGGAILKTVDGGANWNQQTTATFAAPAGFPDFVYFYDGNNGVALGDPNGGYFEIYTTVDGGTNWVRTPQANIAANLAGEFGITDVYTTYGDSTVWFGTNLGRIYKTTDRGLNWTVASTPYPGFIGGLSFKDANYGIVVAADVGTVNPDAIFTTDGGATWNLLPGNTANFAQKQGIIFLPGTDSTFIITSPYLPTGSAVSFDGGNSWGAIDNLIHSDVDFVDSIHGWTGGGEINGPMYKYQVLAPNDVASVVINLNDYVGQTTMSPTGNVHNAGSATQSFNVTMTITGGYSSTKPVSNLAFGQTQTITFDPWTPATTGSYTVTMYTSLAGDANLLNDTITKTVSVLPEFLNYGWLSQPQIPSARFGLAGGFNYVGTYPSGNGYLYSMGGAVLGVGLVTDNDVYDANGGSWGSASAMPSVKYQFSCQHAGGKLYAFGGYSGGFTPDANSYIYTPSTGAWTSGSAMPTPVGDYASGVYHDSLIYFIGGYSGADENLVQIYNTVTDTWSSGTPTIGTAAAGLRGGIYQDKIVIAGGYSQSLGGEIAEAYIGTIDAVNPNLISWAALPNYPGGTVGRLAAGVTFGQTIPLIVFVGGDPAGLGVAALDYTFGYDVLQNGWFIGPAKPTGVSNVSDFVGTVYNDSLYLASVSGYDGSATVLVNEWLNMGSASALAIAQTSATSKQFSVYPNPTGNGKINLMLPSAKENYKLSVYNYLGELISEQNVSNQKTMQLNLSKQAKGIYSVKLSNEKENFMAKVVIQ